MAASISHVPDELTMDDDMVPPAAKRARSDGDSTSFEDVTEESSKKRKDTLKSLCKLSTIISYSKLHRLEKLIASLLTSMKSSLDSNEEAYFPEKLSKKWCIKFEQDIVTVPGSQVCNILSVIVFHLNRDCVEPLEINPLDSNSVRILPIIAQLLHTYMRSVRIAEHTVPAHIVTRFTKYFVTLKLLLGRLGSALLHKEHDNALMASFLSLSVAWGDLQLLLVFYRTPDELPKLSQADNSATNLSGLHSYLSDEQWSLVAQRITNFGEDRCIDLMGQLVAQKVRVMVLLDGSACNDAISLAMKYLMDKPSCSWRQLLDLVDFGLVERMDSTHSLKLADEVVKNLTLKGKVIQVERFQENRPFVLSLLISTLSSIRKCFNVNRKKPSVMINNVFGWLTIDCLSRMDVEQLDKSTSEVLVLVADFINKYLGTPTDWTKPSSLVDLKELSCYLDVLCWIPLQCLHSGLQTYVLCCIFAMMANLSHAGQEASGILHVLHEKLFLGILEGPNAPNITEHLSGGPLILWLLQVDLMLEPSLRLRLLQMLYEMAIRDEDGSLISSVPLLSRKKQAPNMSQAQQVESATILLKALSSVCTSQQFSKENQFMRLKRTLYKKLMDMQANDKLEKESSLLVMEAFHTLLQDSLEKEKPSISLFIPHMRRFVKIALDSALNGNSNSLDFLSMLLKHQKTLDDALKPDFVIHVWRAVAQIPHPNFDIRILFQAASREQYNVITRDMLKNVTKITMMIPTNAMDLERCLSFWSALVSSRGSQGKNKRKRQIIIKLCSILQVAMKLNRITDIQPVLALSMLLVKNKETMLHYEVTNFCLESANIPSSADVSTVVLALKLLSTMLAHSSALVLDLVPAFLQRYLALVERIAQHGAQGVQGDESKLTEGAQEVEKLANAMVAHSKHFQRIASYIIADILRQFEVVTLQPFVKLHLLNAVYSFLRICDSHAIGYLNHSLGPASKQIFQTTYDNYKKHYHYTGRV